MAGTKRGKRGSATGRTRKPSSDSSSGSSRDSSSVWGALEVAVNEALDALDRFAEEVAGALGLRDDVASPSATRATRAPGAAKRRKRRAKRAPTDKRSPSP